MKKTILSSTLSALLFASSIPTPVKAEWYNPATWINHKEEIKPITFDIVYPVPFYKTGVFKWGSILAASIAVGVATVYTGGAASVPGATWIGSLLGGAMGTTWTAGLAALGGGALAAGGLGMAGGAVVIATVTDLSLAVLIDQAASVVTPKNGNHNYTTIKVSIPKWEYGSKKVLLDLKNIHELQEKMTDGDINQDVYRQNLVNYMEDILNNINTSESYYDNINGAIIAYNLGKFSLAEKYINEADRQAKDGTSSFIKYIKALLNLVKNEDTIAAIRNLDKAIQIEPGALNPYILKINILLDNNDLTGAFQTVKLGLDNYDDDNFQLNYLAGMIEYKNKNYKKAIEYFKNALSNTTINPVEAECKVRIALSYKKINQLDNASEWYKDALEEVEDKEYQSYRDKISKLYKNE